MGERVLIVGTGLIGGSVGLALRRADPGYVRVGFDADPARAREAVAAGALDEAATRLASALGTADVVFVATPVGQILDVVEAAAAHTRIGTVVTDVGSTKATIVRRAEELLGEGRHFVGGHPMAGTEGEGVAAARVDLFEGALWILTPTDRSDSEAYRKVNTLVSRLGAKTLALDPSEHDALVARVSHLPYAVATTLMALAGEGGDAKVFSAAAGAFRDITRTAGSNPRIWHDILATNAEAVSRELGELADRLGSLREALETGRLDVVDDLIAAARDARRRLPMKGEREPAEPVTVEVVIPDRAGVLADVTTTVGEGGINIEDVWMEHTTAGGVLGLVVDGAAAAAKAVELLQRKGYRAALLEER
ncbi:MAG: prephenate dehydrogenase/arogenate dehydrogenase family protein [Candidatus Binatia bacterium]